MVTTVKKPYQKPELHIISADDPKYAEIMRTLAAEKRSFDKPDNSPLSRDEPLYPPERKTQSRSQINQ